MIKKNNKNLNSKKKINNNKLSNFLTFLQKFKKRRKTKITNYLYKNKKLNKGIFLKSPLLKDIKYPIPFNLKLINESFKNK